jgi:hypothetical protein
MFTSLRYKGLLMLVLDMDDNSRIPQLGILKRPIGNPIISKKY